MRCIIVDDPPGRRPSKEMSEKIEKWWGETQGSVNMPSRETATTFEIGSGCSDEEPPRRITIIKGTREHESVMVAGPKNGTYVGGPERRDCPGGHSDSRLSAWIVLEFTRVGIDEYACDGCGMAHWVWRCCGHVSSVEPVVSSGYRAVASAVCPGCNENRFETRREPLKERAWTS